MTGNEAEWSPVLHNSEAGRESEKYGASHSRIGGHTSVEATREASFR